MRIVVKVGTQALVSKEGIIANLSNQIAALQKGGHSVVLVSSGAVGYGRILTREVLGREYGNTLLEKQLLASLGQHALVNAYDEALKKHGLLAAQLLLTKQDFHTKEHWTNIQRLLHETLEDQKIIPIINENDAISLEELLFTDNDELAGLIATQIDAKKLLLLTSVDGLMDGSTLIKEIHPDDKHFDDFGEKSTLGRGGMASKLSTARKASSLGITTYIANVNEVDVIGRIANGENVGTIVHPSSKKSEKKRWLAFTTTRKISKVQINECLVERIMQGNQVISILPIGVEDISGDFEKGDLVEVITPKGEVVGRGICRYDSEKLKGYIGKKKSPVLIHYDQLHLEHPQSWKTL